jgi:hypothetical protein
VAWSSGWAWLWSSGGVVWLMTTTSGAGSGSVAGRRLGCVSVEANDGAAGVGARELVGRRVNSTYESVADALPRSTPNARRRSSRRPVADTLLRRTRLKDVNAYFEWQQESGRGAHAASGSTTQRTLRRYWDRGRRILAGAQFDPGRCALRRIRDREDVGYPDGGGYWAMRESTRDDGRPFWRWASRLSIEFD